VQDRAIVLELTHRQEQKLCFAQGESGGRAISRSLEPIALMPDQGQAHVRADEVKVGLDLSLAQGERVGEIAAPLPGLLGDVLDDAPDAADAIGCYVLARHTHH
jgi:hypothetical protein